MMTALRATLPAFLFALILPSLHAQTASYTYVGTSCSEGRLTPSIGPVQFRAAGLPRIGQSFDILTECTTSYANGNRRLVHVLTGMSETSAGGVPLPFDISTLAPAGTFCGLLRTSAEVMVPVPHSANHLDIVSVTFPIPNSGALLGATFFQQVLSIETTTFGPPFRSLALSNAGRAVIGT